MKVFKTRISGKYRKIVMEQGKSAALDGWDRRSPYTNCREEEAWYAGYDAALADIEE